jgi:hypothetical protein
VTGVTDKESWRAKKWLEWGQGKKLRQKWPLGSWLSAFGSWLSAFGLLAFSSWLSAFGFQLLALGFWLLALGF